MSIISINMIIDMPLILFVTVLILNFVARNYDAEVYAFGKRLGEDFSTASLVTAFTHR